MTDGQGTSGTPSGMTHHAFLDKAYTAASDWARFADPKVLGVFVFLGLGAANLVARAAQLWGAGDEGTWGVPRCRGLPWGLRSRRRDGAVRDVRVVSEAAAGR
jgi:hypothetical protein